MAKRGRPKGKGRKVFLMKRGRPKGSVHYKHEFCSRSDCDRVADYQGHVFEITDQLISIEEFARKLGYKGIYHSSYKDPHVSLRWYCLKHYLENEFGLVEAACPECGERFAFDTKHFYSPSDTDEVHCPICMCVVYSRRTTSVDELIEKREGVDRFVKKKE